MSQIKLLNLDRNAKTVKGQKRGFMTAVLYLAPAKVSGYQVCPKSTPGCRAACLNTAGRGGMSSTQRARVKKTKWFFEDRASFMLQLEADIETCKRTAENKGMELAVRLNGTSDLMWERISFVGSDGKTYQNLMERFSNIQFYDYTKHTIRNKIPKNYNLTFSLGENNDKDAKAALKKRLNVAVVFEDSNFPKKFFRHSVVDGDKDDLRFLNGRRTPKALIIALKAKGKAKRDTSGFVRKTA